MSDEQAPEGDCGLTAEERTSIAYAIYEGGSSREDYLAGIEHWIDRLLRERMAWAWDQGVEKASPHGGGYLRSLLIENPYRVSPETVEPSGS